MRRHAISAALLLVFGLLAGCGQKGPLYLPTKAAAPASASSTPAATSAAKPVGPASVAAPAPSSSDGG